MTKRGIIALAPTAPLGSGNQTVRASGRPRDLSQRERVSEGSVIGGRYEVVSFVAEGAFGAVYRARDLDVPGHVVALKLMHDPPRSEDDRERCLREVQLIAAVSHPGVVSFKDHGLHRGRFYIVMPWYEGESLAMRLQRGALSRREAREIFQRLADALAAIHACGIRHQDIKPENILLARFGDEDKPYPVLLDMGVGAWGHELVPAFTPAYVAPETARTHLALLKDGTPEPANQKSDVFALALTLFDSLAPGGRDLHACTGDSASLSRRAERGAELKAPGELLDLEKAFTRWLSLDPNDRPTAREFSRELCILTEIEDRKLERQRLRARLMPVFVVVLCVVSALAVQLRKERVRSKDKDARIGEQAHVIDEAREALTALELSREKREREAKLLSSANAGLRELLSKAQNERSALRDALDAEQKALRELKRELKQTNERALELEAGAVDLAEKLTQQMATGLELSRSLARAEVARRALIEERDRLEHELRNMSIELERESAERARLASALEENERERVQLAAEVLRYRLKFAPRPAERSEQQLTERDLDVNDPVL